jgi:hypothetical protein
MRAEAFIRAGLEVRFTVTSEADAIIAAVLDAIAAAGNAKKGEDLPAKF